MTSESVHQPRHAPGRAGRPPTAGRLLLSRTLHEVARDELVDEAAALTYYSVFALFPATLAVLGVIGLVASRRSAFDALIAAFDSIGGAELTSALRPPLEQLVTSHASGWALVFGLAGAVWGASGYCSAIGRSLNRMYDVLEGRGQLRVLLTQLACTCAIVVLTVVLTGALLAGPWGVAELDRLLPVQTGLAEAWLWIRVPLVAALMFLIICVLYTVTPNVRRGLFSWGATLALFAWGIATVLVNLYIATVANFSATYGTLAALIGLLLWLWLSNLIVLLGAEFDSELLRIRQLREGQESEWRVHTELKATAAIDKRTEQGARDILRSRAFRTDAQRPRQRRPTPAATSSTQSAANRTVR